MSDTMARDIVTWTWLALFLMVLLILAAMYATGWIGQEWFEKLLSQISRLYAPYVGAVVTFHFAAGREHRGSASANALAIALLSAVIWNGLNLTGLALLWGAKIEADGAITVMDKGANISWLIAPGMGYFFGSAGERRRRSAPSRGGKD
jgi:hypothetical protein